MKVRGKLVKLNPPIARDNTDLLQLLYKRAEARRLGVLYNSADVYLPPLPKFDWEQINITSLDNKVEKDPLKALRPSSDVQVLETTLEGFCANLFLPRDANRRYEDRIGSMLGYMKSMSWTWGEKEWIRVCGCSDHNYTSPHHETFPSTSYIQNYPGCESPEPGSRMYRERSESSSVVPELERLDDDPTLSDGEIPLSAVVPRLAETGPAAAAAGRVIFN